MMSQKTRDIGLIKGVGCPNDLVFGYFVTELLIITSIGCFSGVFLGIITDFASTSLLASFQVSQEPPDFWLVLLVFCLFFVLALVFGAKPILDYTKIEPAKTISPTHYFGLSHEGEFRVMSRSGLTLKLALRSLYRRKSATIRMIICLSAVFVFVTVAVAGGIIADRTTKSWIENAIGRDVVLIAHKDMCHQYQLLLSRFYGVNEDSHFVYTEEKFLVCEDILNQLKMEQGITTIDERLVLEAHVEEIQNYTINPETGATIPVGDGREGESLIVGVDSDKAISKWFLQGKSLEKDQAWNAIIGDSLAQRMFELPSVQSIRIFNNAFSIVGVCLDPITNGNVTYVHLQTLQNVTGVSKPNILMIRIDPAVNRKETLNRIREKIETANPDFTIYELNETLDKALYFLSYIWSTIMFLPLFSLASASLCLVGYVMLAVAEQRQEFGVLRSVGAKPKTLLNIVSVQNLVVLLSSYAIGTSFGIMITLLILVQKPLVTSYIVLEIGGWLLVALAATFIISLYPAVKFSKKKISEIMT
jgi:ABC-type antimicrobial peptide transport system permease subunit